MLQGMGRCKVVDGEQPVQGPPGLRPQSLEEDRSSGSRDLREQMTAASPTGDR